MALTLENEYEIVNIGTGIIVRDTTVYGGDEAERNTLTVDFIITDKRKGTIIEVTYDGATVEEILIPITHDGWYEILMTVSDGVDYSDEKTLGILVTERFCECKAELLSKLTDKICGCENPKVFEKLFVMTAQLIGIEALVAKNDLKSADMAIERLNLECKRANKDCGC